MFKASDYLEEAIANNNVIRIRSVFTVIAHEDPSFSTGKFDQTLEYVKSKEVMGLFTPFEGREFQPKESWNEDYWALVVAALVDNFCMERIDHLKEISRVLYPPKSKPQTPPEHDGKQGSQGDHVSQKKAVPIVMTVGLAAACVVGIAIGAKGVATVAGIGAIAAGVYSICKE